MKKILFLINSLRGGGAEKVLVNLVNQMDTTKYSITVMTLFGGGVNKQFLLPHINYINCFKRPPKGFVHYTKLFSPRLLHYLFIKEYYDIEVSYLQGICTRIVSGAPASVRKVMWMHNFDRPDRVFRSKKECRHLLEEADVVACVSKKTMLQVNAISSSINAKVIYNTHDINSIIKCSQQPAPIMDVNCLKLVFVGTIYPVKGLKRLITLLYQLFKENGCMDFHLYLVGEGPQKKDLISYTGELQFHDHVSFIGYDTNPYKYVAKADWYVCSSYTEGFSGSVSEATILGIPTLTTRCSGMEEILGEKNEYGLVVENSDKALLEGLRLILFHPEITQDYKERVKLRKDFFSPIKTVSSAELLLDSI